MYRVHVDKCLGILYEISGTLLKKIEIIEQLTKYPNVHTDVITNYKMCVRLEETKTPSRSKNGFHVIA